MNSLMTSLVNLPPFAKAAYIVAWVVYLGYLCRILLRMRLVEAERKELERERSGGVRKS
jgi:hypothetical protein